MTAKNFAHTKVARFINKHILFSPQETVAEGSTSAQVFGILSPACVMASALGYGIGFGPILYNLTGEIMPPRVKSLCCSLCLAFR